MDGDGFGQALAPQQWAGFDRFKRVQDILDRNKCVQAAACRCRAALKPSSHARRLLINEINANHESKQCARLFSGSMAVLRTLTQHLSCFRREGLQRNVVLIRELNNNIAKVVELYRELSVRRGTHWRIGRTAWTCADPHLRRRSASWAPRATRPAAHEDAAHVHQHASLRRCCVPLPPAPEHQQRCDQHRGGRGCAKRRHVCEARYCHRRC